MTTKQKLIAHLASLPVHQTTARRLARAVGASAVHVTIQLQQLVEDGKLDIVERHTGPGGGTTYRYLEGFDGVAHPEHTLAVAVHQ